MISIFKKKKELPEGLTLALEIEGHNLYVFDSLDNTPVSREFGTRMAYHQYQLGIRWSDLRAYSKITKEKANAGDLVGVAAMAHALDGYINNYASQRLINELSGHTILVDDEPIEKSTLKHRKIKQELLKNEEVQAFFLNTTLRLLTDLGETLNISKVKESMRELKNQRLIREMNFLSLIQTNLTEKLWEFPHSMSRGT